MKFQREMNQLSPTTTPTTSSNSGGGGGVGGPGLPNNLAVLRAKYMMSSSLAYWDTVYSATNFRFPSPRELFEEYSEAIKKSQIAFMKTIISLRQVLDGTIHPLVWSLTQR